MCKNCGSTIGPFYRAWKERGEIIITTPPLCKNTKENANRISECVSRREKIDTERYKEQLHGYA
jgi:hypothetical protein